MKTTKRILTVIALLAWSSSLSLAAPLGTAFQYQGHLGVGTNAANGLYDLKFTLYDALSGGAQLGPLVTPNAVAVSNGFFAVALDFGVGVFDGNARWLEVAVRTNGDSTFVVLSPRQALTPVPYALFAPNSAVGRQRQHRQRCGSRRSDVSQHCARTGG